MRRPLYIANWKMNKTELETRAWFEGLSREDLDPDACDMAVAVPFTSLRTAAGMIAGSGAASLPVSLAAQNCHWENSGALTGEISPPMLADLTVRFVLVGHSERRQLFGETDERVAHKVKAVAGAGMIPVLCLGETQEERDSGRTEPVVERQLRRGLEGLDIVRGECVIAYEPVWAIGTGRTATSSQIAQAHVFLRTIFSALASPEIAARTRILYGGSVNASSVASIAALPEVDGSLVGGASLDPASFLDLVRRGCAA